MFTLAPSTLMSANRLRGIIGALSAACRGQARYTGSQTGAALIVAEARRRAPRGPDIATRRQHLVDTIGARVLSHSETVTQVGIGTDDPVGPMMEYGTRPHVIVPRTAGALYWTGAAHPVGRVNHPGTRPHPFLIPAAEAMGAAACAAVGKAVVDQARETGGMGAGGVA